MSNSPIPKRSPSQAEFSENLMKWIQPIAQAKGLTVRNFQADWQNGMMFCAILHEYFPHLIDYNSLVPDNKEQNLQKAFLGFEKVGIESLLDAADIAVCPDKLSILTYLGHLNSRLGGRRKANSAPYSMANGIDEIIAAGTRSPAPADVEKSPSTPPVATIADAPSTQTPESVETTSAETVDSESLENIETKPLASLTGGRAQPPVGRRQPTRVPSRVITEAYTPPPMEFSSSESPSMDNAEPTTAPADEEPSEARAKHPGGFSLFGSYDPSKSRLLRAPSQAITTIPARASNDISPRSVAPVSPTAASSLAQVQEAVAATKAELEAKYLSDMRELRQELAAAQRAADEARLSAQQDRESASRSAKEATLESEGARFKQQLLDVESRHKSEMDQLKASHAKELEATRQNISSLESDKRTLEERNQTLENDAKLQLENAHSKHATEAAANASSSAALESQVSQLKTELHNSRNDYNQARDENEELSTKIKTLVQQLTSEEAKVLQLQADLHAHTTSASAGQSASVAEISALKETIERMEKQFLTEKTELTQKIGRLEDSFNEAVAAQQSDMDAERVELKKSIQAIENERNELQQLHATALKERQQAEVLLQRIETEKALLDAQKAATAETGSPNSANQALIDLIATVREEMSVLQNSVQANQAAIALFNDSVSTKLATLEKDNASAQATLQKASQFATEMIVVRTKLRELDLLTTSAKDVTAAHVESFSKSIASLQTSVGTLEEKMSSLQKHEFVTSVKASEIFDSKLATVSLKWNADQIAMEKRLKELETENARLSHSMETFAKQPSAPVAKSISPEEVKALVAAEIANALQQFRQQQPTSSVTGRALPSTPTVQPPIAAAVQSDSRESAAAAAEKAAVEREKQRLADLQAAKIAEERKQAEERKRVEDESKRIAAEQEQLRADAVRKEAENALQLEKQRLAQQLEAKMKREEEEAVEQDRIAAEKAKIAEEHRIAQEKARIVEEQRIAQEKARIVEEQRIAMENARIAEEQRIAEEKARVAELKRVAEEEQRAAAEAQKEAERARIAEENQRAAERAHAEKLEREALAKAEEEKRKEAEKAKQAKKAEDDRARIEEEARRLVASQAQVSPATKKSLFDDVFDFSSSPTTKKTATPAKKVSLFDDDDDIFSSKKPSTTAPSPAPRKGASIFDDDDDDVFGKPAAKKSAPGGSFMDRLSSAFN